MKNDNKSIRILKVMGIFALMIIVIILFLNEYSTPNFAKPIIYIYPEEEIDISIKVSKPENLIVTYPQYKDGWYVKTYSDGTLISDNKKYYGLYWEGYQSPEVSDYYGFVVSKDDLADFLDEKLTILGLNWKERNEFIIYWLPQMIENDYNFITFADIQSINDCMELNIDPQPDTLIRICMSFKKVNKDYNYKEQILTPVERTGYTVVEWGGSKLN